MRGRLALLGAVCISWSFAQGCGGDSSTDDGGADGTVDDVVTQPDTSGNDVVTNPDTGPDDSGTADTGTDAPTTSDASDASTIDTGIAQWSCGSVKVTDCAQCTGYTQPCAFCNVQDASVLTGVCVQTGDYCSNSIPQGFQSCLCANDASTCPEAFQICTNQNRCHTCTDNTFNNGLTCENGKTCQIDAGGCK